MHSRITMPAMLLLLVSGITCAANPPSHPLPGPVAGVTISASLFAGSARIITTWPPFTTAEADSIFLTHSSGITGVVRHVWPAGARTADTLSFTLPKGISLTGAVCPAYIRNPANVGVQPNPCPTWSLNNPLGVPVISVRADTVSP